MEIFRCPLGRAANFKICLSLQLHYFPSHSVLAQAHSLCPALPRPALPCLLTVETVCALPCTNCEPRRDQLHLRKCEVEDFPAGTVDFPLDVPSVAQRILKFASPYSYIILRPQCSPTKSSPPSLPWPALPCPGLPCPGLPWPACPGLPCPGLPCPGLPWPAL